jgi:hypothetical protein
MWPIVIGGIVLAALGYAWNTREREKKGGSVTSSLKTTDDTIILTLGKDISIPVGSLVIIGPLDSSGNPILTLPEISDESVLKPLNPFLLKALKPGDVRIQTARTLSIIEVR